MPLEVADRGLLRLFADLNLQFTGIGIVVFRLLGVVAFGFGELKFHVAADGPELRRMYALAVMAALVAMVPVVSVCFVAGLPVGIWALVVLLRGDVRAAFA